MAQLYTKVKLYIEANSETWNDAKVLLQNDGEEDYIKEWSYSFAKPTNAQLNALESDADDYEYNLGQIAKRKAEYGSAISQMENIIENGLSAEQTRVNSIKEKYPKR